jgi:hypothetical protein
MFLIPKYIVVKIIAETIPFNKTNSTMSSNELKYEAK